MEAWGRPGAPRLPSIKLIRAPAPTSGRGQAATAAPGKTTGNRPGPGVSLPLIGLRLGMPRVAVPRGLPGVVVPRVCLPRVWMPFAATPHAAVRRVPVARIGLPRRAPNLRLPQVSAAEVGQVVTAARAMLPPTERLLYYTGLGALAVFGAIEWPVAAAIGAGTVIAQRVGRVHLPWHSQPNPAKTGPARNGPANIHPARTGPARNGPARNGPANIHPARTSPARTSPARTGPARTTSR